jgi:hypothetical protein
MSMASLSVTGQKSVRPKACLCCSAPASSEEWGMVSPFLAERALGEAPSRTLVLRCGNCGFAWSERGLTPEQAGKLYVGYRGEEYFLLRNRHEPWYRRSKNDGIGSESTMDARRAAMAGTLARAGALRSARSVGIAVDFGGDKGQMLKDFPDGQKWVYEFSGVEPSPWARQVASLADLEGQCNFAMACQVLEHVESPLETALQVAALAKPGGWVYLEVPDERWVQSMAGSAWRARWLDAVARRPLLLRGLDFASTASRLALGWIPPFGFWSMREHLNFFTPKSLAAIAEKAGLEVVLVEENASGLALAGVRP